MKHTIPRSLCTRRARIRAAALANPFAARRLQRIYPRAWRFARRRGQCSRHFYTRIMLEFAEVTP